MPGRNCCVVNCGSSRYTKNIGIFQLPSEKKYPKWRESFLSELKKTRVVDGHFKELIEKNNVYTCERHFQAEDIVIHNCEKIIRKTLKEGSLPLLNMGRTSYQNSKVARRHISIVKDHVEITGKNCYENLDDLRKKIVNLKTLQEWNIDINFQGQVLLTYFCPEFDTSIPHFRVIIDDGLGFTIQIFHWFLPEDHILYVDNKRSLRNITVANLIKGLMVFQLCHGVKVTEKSEHFIDHSIPKSNEAMDANQDDEKALVPYQSICFKRTLQCIMLIQKCENKQCVECFKAETKTKKKKLQVDKQKNMPMKSKAPVSGTSTSRIKATLQMHRLKCSQLEKELEKMKNLLTKETCPIIEKEISDNLMTIFDDNYQRVTPFMKLFWEQQRKMFKTSNQGVRFHPMIIRYCLSLYAKSSSAYEEIRNSGILRLPSTRTLKDYKNFITPTRGFQKDIVDDLKLLTSTYSENQRFVTLMFDEMKIKSNLVFDKHHDQLIGFVDLGDPDTNFNCFGEDETNLATHALVFYLRGLMTSLKYCFAYFGTNGITSTQLMPIFWEAVFILEKLCKIKVIVATSDGASANRSFFKLHKFLMFNTESTVCYRTLNLFSTSRYIYFFADAPHLMKTARNCLHHSSFGKDGSRIMWNNGQYLLWQHIVEMHQKDLIEGLKLLPKITDQHVFLNSYSVMTVKFATQVLSTTMSNVLEKFGPEQVSETAQYCSYLDRFFDCLNVRHPKEHIRKRKPFLKPYTSQNDERFNWLQNSFLKYLSDWKVNIENRPGEFTKKDRSSMFMSQQTHEGLCLTTYSVIEVTRYLLSQGFEYVLTERFCQDPAEEYFGAQRQHGRRCENPDLFEFGYNSNILRIQKEVSHTTGNSRGKYDKKRSWESVSDVPLPKRKTK